MTYVLDAKLFRVGGTRPNQRIYQAVAAGIPKAMSGPLSIGQTT